MSMKGLLLGAKTASASGPFSFSVTANRTNGFNIYSSATSLGWDQNQEVIFTVPQDIWITGVTNCGTSRSSATAIDMGGTFPNGLTIVVNGYVMGRALAGNSNNSFMNNTRYRAGTGINATDDVTIEFGAYGKVMGGGGFGGNARFRDTDGGKSTSYDYAFAFGGGGAGGGQTGNAGGQTANHTNVAALGSSGNSTYSNTSYSNVTNTSTGHQFWHRGRDNPAGTGGVFILTSNASNMPNEIYSSWVYAYGGYGGYETADDLRSSFNNNNNAVPNQNISYTPTGSNAPTGITGRLPRGGTQSSYAGQYNNTSDAYPENGSGVLSTFNNLGNYNYTLIGIGGGGGYYGQHGGAALASRNMGFYTTTGGPSIYNYSSGYGGAAVDTNGYTVYFDGYSHISRFLGWVSNV